MERQNAKIKGQKLKGKIERQAMHCLYFCLSTVAF
jgi:hypothetical protein